MTSGIVTGNHADENSCVWGPPLSGLLSVVFLIQEMLRFCSVRGMLMGGQVDPGGAGSRRITLAVTVSIAHRHQMCARFLSCTTWLGSSEGDAVSMLKHALHQSACGTTQVSLTSVNDACVFLKLSTKGGSWRRRSLDDIQREESLPCEVPVSWWMVPGLLSYEA
jgi:hypothetical protein